MYIVAIAWAFVTVLMAAAEAMSGSIVGGLMTLIFYGVLPLGLILYLLGTPQRRRNQKQREQTQQEEARAAESADSTKSG